MAALNYDHDVCFVGRTTCNMITTSAYRGETRILNIYLSGLGRGRSNLRVFELPL
jgi:hypothetical protein